jgi:hypothetical protein
MPESQDDGFCFIHVITVITDSVSHCIFIKCIKILNLCSVNPGVNFTISGISYL